MNIKEQRAKNKEQRTQQEEIERLEKEVEGRLKHIAFLKTSPERVSRGRKFSRILEFWRESILWFSGVLAIMMTFGFVIVMFRDTGPNFDGGDYFVMTMTLALWLNWFLDLSKSYYDDPQNWMEED